MVMCWIFSVHKKPADKTGTDESKADQTGAAQEESDQTDDEQPPKVHKKVDTKIKVKPQEKLNPK